jgi:hypothetical protein
VDSIFRASGGNNILTAALAKNPSICPKLFAAKSVPTLRACFNPFAANSLVIEPELEELPPSNPPKDSMALPIVELESVLWEELLLMVVLLVSEVIVVFFVFLHDCASIELSSKIEKMNDTTRDRFINF